eukprot:6202577-Pleurochrysis_carterae.AAC.1
MRKHLYAPWSSHTGAYSKPFDRDVQVDNFTIATDAIWSSRSVLHTIDVRCCLLTSVLRSFS